jgi:CRP-like cAMP-binding protein
VPTQHIVKNRILRQLSPDELRSIQPWVTALELRANTVLHEQGAAIDHIYFPSSGMVSLLAIMQNGEAIETGIIGADGVLGGDAPINGHLSAQATVQLDGAARQNAACHALHSVRGRLCRWLLQSQDMIGSATFILTQEFLSHMLGVRRNTVSVEAHYLQQAGLIRYSRGHITILNRDGLEDCACECYSMIRAETDKLMGAA